MPAKPWSLRYADPAKREQRNAKRRLGPLVAHKPKGAPVQFPYNPDLALWICFDIAAGGKLSDVAKTRGLPSDVTIYEWMMNEPAFAEAYTRAREIRAHRMFDQLETLADSADSENAQAVRIRVETRRWMLAKIVPKVYGDKITADVTLSATLEQLVLKSLERQAAGEPKTIEHDPSTE